MRLVAGESSNWGVDREGLVGLMKAFPYTISEAISDIIDNSIDACAKNITVEINHIDNHQYVLIKDDGKGIPKDEIDDVVSIGKRRNYKPEDLGHFGVGLKTAGLSQADNVTIFSKEKSENMSTRRISVNWMKETNQWDKVLHSSTDSPVVDHIMQKGYLPGEHGTTILLENLHRFDTLRDGDSSDSHTIMNTLPQVEAHLAMVFHRFLEDQAHPRHFTLHFPAKGGSIEALNPLEPQNNDVKYGTLTQNCKLSIDVEGKSHKIPVQLTILSHSKKIPESDRSRGRIADAVGSWTSAEGAYLYRNDRLVAHSDWFGIPDISKTAIGTLRRSAVELDPKLDDYFGLDPSKSNYRLPLDIRKKIKEEMLINRTWVNGDKERAFSNKASNRYRTEGKGVGNKRKKQGPTKRKEIKNIDVKKRDEESNDKNDTSAENDNSEIEQYNHVTSALVRPLSERGNSHLFATEIDQQEQLIIDINMAHPWYVPFKAALRRWLDNG